MANMNTLKIPSSPGGLSQASTEVASPSRTTPIDPTKDVNIPVLGWPTLANVIAQKSDLEAFPTFRDLNIKSLLYYQAELVHLRKKLHKAEWADFLTSDDESLASTYGDNLRSLFVDRDSSTDSIPLPEQWVLIEKIRTVLEKYNAAVLQFSEMSALRDADECNIRTLMGCVKKVGRDSNALSGDGAFTWGNIHEVTPKEKSLLELFWGLFTGFFVSPDVESPIVTDIFPERLVMPRKRNAPDGLTIWVRRSFVPFYDQMEKKYPPPLSIKYRKYVILPWVMLVFTWLIPVSFWHLFLRQWHKAFPTQASPSDVEKKSSDASIYGTTSHDSNETSNSDTSAQSQVLENLTEYSGAWILRVTSIMTTVVACLLPTVAITVLAKVHSMGLILGLITLFTALFAFGLVLLSSSSSRVEIFTATAAFSAVMVVFVQNQIGPQ